MTDSAGRTLSPVEALAKAREAARTAGRGVSVEALVGFAAALGLRIEFVKWED